jgi:hypothetical protein
MALPTTPPRPPMLPITRPLVAAPSTPAQREAVPGPAGEWTDVEYLAGDATGLPTGATESQWSAAAEANTEVSEPKRKPRHKSSLKQRGPGMRLTERDIVILQFLTRYRFANYPQIAGYTGRSEEALRQAMGRLRRAGLVTTPANRETRVIDRDLWLPTKVGVDLSGLDLPVPTYSPATAFHTLGLVDIGIRFEAAGETVVTEREIRAADTRERPTDRMLRAQAFYGDPAAGRPPFVISLGAGQGQFTHIPDAVLLRAPSDGSPQTVAIELELRRKPPTQWRKILRAYRDSPNIGYVVYFTDSKPIRDGLAQAAKALSMEHMMEVRRYKKPDHRGAPNESYAA